MSMLTSNEVAERLRVKPVTVLRYIRRGQIQAHFFGRSYQVDEQEVESFLHKSEGKRKVRKTA